MRMTSTWKGALVGSLVGATAALLMTPMSGKKLRESLKRKSDRAYDKTSEVAESVRDKTAELAKDIRDKTEEMKNKVKDKASELADDTAEFVHNAAKK